MREELSPDSSYRPVGEEIDGSFELDNRVFLIEAKWRDKPTSAATVYAFEGKVERKFPGTVGVFVSMAGYSKPAIDAIQTGKCAPLIFFDGADIEAIILGGYSFRSILRSKLRRAGAEGKRYVPFEPTPGPLQVDVLTAQDVEEDDMPVNVLIMVEGAGGRTAVREVLDRLGQTHPTFARSNFHIGSFPNLVGLDEALKSYTRGGSSLHGIVVVLGKDLEIQYWRDSTYTTALDTVRRYSRQVGKLPIRVLTIDETFQVSPGLRRNGSLKPGNISRLSEFLGSLGEPAPWDGEARGAVRAALESADWDFEDECVRIWVDDGDRGRQSECESVDKLRDVLEGIAQEAYYASAPFEGGEPVFGDPDLESMVNDELEWYAEELERLQWSL